jgi:hypothetical protein
MESLVDSCIKDGVDKEKCIVSQYRTSLEQKTIFEEHIETVDREKIPIEWVIDIADESNGWFYGTAYHFNDLTHMLHVMVPDKLNPSFNGDVQLDYRTVHLIECVDGKTDALFNKCVRDSVMKVKWELEWFEEGSDSNGKWLKSYARYYIRTANQILVEDAETEGETHGFVMLTADHNVRLIHCVKGKGQPDFNRLVNETLCQSTPEALIEAELIIPNAKEKSNESTKQNYNNQDDDDKYKDSKNLSSGLVLKKLADMTKSLRECVSDVLDERENLSKEKILISEQFKSFSIDGDLDAGLTLLDNSLIEIEKIKNSKNKNKDKIENNSDTTADDAWYLVQKLEKSMIKLLKSGGNELVSGSEIETLRRNQISMKKELAEKDRELEQLRKR